MEQLTPVMANSEGSESYVPMLAQIRERTEEVFDRRPCLWQQKVAQAFLLRDRDIVCIAGTGKGKTLTFWMPLLFSRTSIQIIITPLNLLGEQNVRALERAGIRAISIHAETATIQNFQAIENLEYRVVIISPEQAMRDAGGFEQLLKKPLFVSHLVGIVIDEAHCVSAWGEFRPEYRELGRLKYTLPMEIPFLITSATLSSEVLHDVKRLLHLRSGDKLVTIHRSTDRPNIKLGVKPIRGSLRSYADLAFLIPDGWKAGDPPPPKFLIFFDNIATAIEAAQSVRSRLPLEFRDKIKWFNADMSTAFKSDEVESFSCGDTWGFFTTESFGMGFDMPDIRFVGQWRATCSLATLWQRFGRAVRDMSLTGVAVLFAEREYFDQYRKEKEERKLQRAANKKRKATTILVSSSHKQLCRVEGDDSSRTSAPFASPAESSGVLAAEESEPGNDSSDDEVELARSASCAVNGLGGDLDGSQIRGKIHL